MGDTDWTHKRQRSHQRFLGRPLAGGGALDGAGGRAQWRSEGSNDTQGRAGSKCGGKGPRTAACQEVNMESVSKVKAEIR